MNEHKGVALLLNGPKEPEQAVRDYAKERALVDAKHLLSGLDEVSVENLGLGRVTGKALRFASMKCRVRILNVVYFDDCSLADTLNDMLAAGKLLWEAAHK